jgi:hypothetical protein
MAFRPPPRQEAQAIATLRAIAAAQDEYFSRCGCYCERLTLGENGAIEVSPAYWDPSDWYGEVTTCNPPVDYPDVTGPAEAWYVTPPMWWNWRNSVYMDGYRFDVVACTESMYELRAVPVEVTGSCHRAFFLDNSGRLRSYDLRQNGVANRRWTRALFSR